MSKNYKLMLVLFLISYSLSNAMEPRNCDNKILQEKEIVTVVFPCINNYEDEDKIGKKRYEEQVIQIVGIVPFTRRRIVKTLGYYNLTIDPFFVSTISIKRTVPDKHIRALIVDKIIVPLLKIKDASGREISVGFFKALNIVKLEKIRKLQGTKADIETKQKIFDDEKNSLFKKWKIAFGHKQSKDEDSENEDI